MKAIWKFPLAERDDQTVSMPDDAQILCVQVQNGTACLWALVEPEAPKAVRRFKTYGTGHQHADIPGKYIGSYQLLGGAIVFHVFEEAAQ